MTRRTVNQLPDAPPEAVATGFMIVADTNGNEYRAPTSVLGGAHIFFTDEANQTPFVYGRLTSPGHSVVGTVITLTATPIGGGTAVVKTATTDDLGDFSFDWTKFLTRGVTYVIEARAAIYLATTTVKTIAVLAAPATGVVATATGKVGDVISIADPVFTGNPTAFRYRYLRGPNYVIPGADQQSYTSQPDDDGDVITAQVMAINAGGESQWYSANPIGPMTNKTSVLLSSPVIAGSTAPGGRMTVTSPGAASENAVIKSDEWQIDQAKIPAQKAAVTRYMQGAAAASAPTLFPDGSNHHGIGLSSVMYTGTNTYSYSVGIGATENDYIPIAVGAAGGNEGAQLYDLFIRHLNTNAALRIKMFAAKYRNGALVEEVQMPRFGATVGQELAEWTPVGNTTPHWTLTHDFGEWLAGDWLVFRQQVRNTSGSSTNNYQWDARSGASYATLPLGAVQDLQKTLSVFTTRADMGGKKVSLLRTFTNNNNDVVVRSNEITLDAAVAQTLVPANTVVPTIFARSDRSNTVWQVDLGAWSNQPTGYTVQWTDNGVDIAGAIFMSYTPTSAQEGHTIACRVTPSNGIGTGTAQSTAGKVVQPAAAYFNPATGNDANDGVTAETAKQTLASSETIPSGATAILMGDFATRLKLGSGRNYEGLGPALTSIGSTSITYAIDQYTDDGSLGRNNVKISKMTIRSGDRAINARNGSNWVIEDVVLADVGFSPLGGIAENASGFMFYKNNGITLTRVEFNLVNSDAFFSDTNDKVIVQDCKFLPVATVEGDTIQTRADRTVNNAPGPHQKGFVLRGTLLDMHSRKTSSGKGCLVTNMQDYAYIHDNVMDGNNFVHGTDEGDNQVFCRNVTRYARKSSYSFGYGIGGYDNQPASHNHQLYDNSYYDMNRALSFTGISVTGYTGEKSGRVDIVAHDETFVKCAIGVRVDRPTSGQFRGCVFHNVTKPLDRTLTTLPPGGDIQAFLWSDHFTYNGSVTAPPAVVTRAEISGGRNSGDELTGPNSVFDIMPILAAFPDAVITHSYQWRRHKPAVQWAQWTEHLGYMCEWIEGATASSYTITDADQGCLVSRVDRIHLTFTEGGVVKTITALAYDATYASSAPVTRTGDLAVALPVMPTSANVSAAAAEGTLVIDMPDLLPGATRTLLHPSRAYDAYTGGAVAVDANGDIVRGSAALTVGSTFSLKIRQKRGIDVVDTQVTFTVVA
ncbi:pectin lyase fold domain-containing protein [Rhizobium phage RHph_Y2_17_1]|nr:pectin lyase fold domain-containing protein [Rhizobium phage RHph_Y2_11]QIG75742.1 pectin lyase fold domain-containing protein [Rhizobium phage RHph_Y2_17_1]